MRRMPITKFNIPRTALHETGKSDSPARALLPRGRDHRHGRPVSLPQQGVARVCVFGWQDGHGYLPVRIAPRDSRRGLLAGRSARRRDRTNGAQAVRFVRV